jgi:hypothetical protein
MEDPESSNFQLFRDCISTPLIEKSVTKPEKKTRKGRKKTAIKPIIPVEEQDDAEELAEFIDVCFLFLLKTFSLLIMEQYIAHEIFTNLPSDLRTLTYSTWLNTPSLQTLYTDSLPQEKINAILDPLPPTITDSLLTYHFLPPSSTLTEFLTPPLTTYLTSLLTPPPPPSMTRDLASSCEICQRTWIPLTYHHLIPRGVHVKVLKRGWHTEDQLENVAWLCRACHSFVHRVAGLEELARSYFTVERLLEREDVNAFAGWAGKVRWKAK